jgi:hypothetical protein
MVWLLLEERSVIITLYILHACMEYSGECKSEGLRCYSAPGAGRAGKETMLLVFRFLAWLVEHIDLCIFGQPRTQ